MDPDENLKEQLELVAWLEGGWADAGPHDLYAFTMEKQAKVERLCELVTALHGWLSKGGFLPKEWQR